MGVSLIAAPVQEPLDLETVKDHLRITGDDEDALLLALRITARHIAERITGRALITQTWKLTMDGWPLTVLRLPKPPLRSVTEVKYFDAGGAEQTWDSAKYDVDADPTDPRLAPAYGETWPVLQSRINAVSVTFESGYGAVATTVPAPIRHAMLLIIGHLYANREDTDGDRMPQAARHLLWLYRVINV